MPSSRSGGLKLAAVASLCLALLFIVLGGIRLGYTLWSVALLGAAGLSIGAVAAPELEPQFFRYPALWQVCFAVAGCVSIALLLAAGGEGLALAVLVGVALGIAAPVWVKHVQLP
jgi:hypothetical protein